MLTNFDCTAFYVADRAHLVQTLSVLPEYLRNAASESGSVIDYRDWQIPLGRRFRALKLWFVIRSYGLAGLRDHVRTTSNWPTTSPLWSRRPPTSMWSPTTPLGSSASAIAEGTTSTSGYWIR